MKKQKVDNFSKKLKELRISHVRQSDYHVQVMSVHNFYPSKNSHYNSETNKKRFYNDKILKDHNTFVEFIRNN